MVFFIQIIIISNPPSYLFSWSNSNTFLSFKLNTCQLISKMVALTSVTKCIALISIMALGLSDAAPVAEGKQSQTATPYIDGTNVTDFTLPPLISSRTKPISSPVFAGNLNAEAESMEKNKAWFIAHGGNYNNVTAKRDSNSVGGMTLDLPDIVPPIPASAKVESVVIASSEQLAKFKFHAALAAASYCRAVVPLGKWNCENCLKYVPDGKLLVTFSSLLADTNGFVLKSDAQKTIHLVFRGTNSIRSSITVSHNRYSFTVTILILLYTFF